MVSEINDLVVLGRAAPEPIKDGRETVCLGGYSDSVGYVRLYPTKRRMTNLKRWNVVHVPVEKDRSHDAREESYKIAGSKEDWDTLHQKVELVDRLDRKARIQLAHKLANDCPKRLRENRRSMGVVEPDSIFDVELEPEDGPGPQLDLTMSERKGKGDYPNKLYIEYECDSCIQNTHHRQHCIEWGMYKYWDKNDDDGGVIDALNLLDDDWKVYFFVGNLNRHPTSYIVISILRWQKSNVLEAGVPIGDQSTIADF